MLKRKSNPWGRLRYLSILPLAAIAVAAFAHPTIARELEAISSSEFMELIPDEKQIIHEKAIAHAIAKDSALVQVSERARQIGDSISLIVAKHQPEIERAVQEAMASARIRDSISMIMEQYRPELERLQKEMEALQPEFERLQKEMEARQPEFERLQEEFTKSFE